MGAAPTLEACWQLRLFGGLELSARREQINRWPSRAAALLLARLALWPQRVHPREELVELLWPGVSLPVGRNRLRQALSTLRSLVEPPGQPVVIVADRLALRIAPGAVACDVHAFERLLRSGQALEAARLYRGELMPGFYDEWVDDERRRLSTLAERAPVAPARVPAPRLAPDEARAPPRPTDNAALITLPSYLTRHFGSDAQAARLRGWLLAHRLVTLLGPGGSGKTRLAVELALALRDTPDFGHDSAPVRPFDRVAFVALQGCTDAGQMFTAAGAALRLPVSATDTTDRLVGALEGRPVLLVLDNFEQLVDSAAPLVATLLSRLPLLHLLVTSRRALALDGEREFVLAPLDVPASDAPLTASADSPAVALFVDRARAVRADFHLGPRNALAIAALVRSLEGMPLAIELAASRVRSLSPQQMADMLADGPGALDLLARGGPRGGPDPRHASMRRVIDWSWQQLDPVLQETLAALTAFTDHFGTQAAASVLAVPAAQAAQRLADLAANSLVRTLPAAGDEPQFRISEPLREFAAERLPAAEAVRLRARVRDWLIAHAGRQSAAGNFSAAQSEMPNVLTALRSARADDASLQALHLALAMRRCWDTDGMPLATLDALTAATREVEATLDATPALRCDIHEMLAHLHFAAGFVDVAAGHAATALACAEHDPPRRAQALVCSAWVQLASHRHGLAQDMPLREALALARACGDLESQARALHLLAIVENQLLHQTDAALSLFAQAQALWERLGDRRMALARLRNRAPCWQAGGRHEQALASCQACEQAALDGHDWVGVLDAALSQGAVLAELRRWQASAEATARCVNVCWHHHNMHGLGYALWNQARVLARLRRPVAAAQLMAFAEPFWTTRFGPLRDEDRAYPRRVRALVEAQLGHARAEALWAEGRTLSLADAVGLARDGHLC